jgi:hypothetical protein
MSMRDFEVAANAMEMGATATVPRRIKGRFLKGPVPLVWLQTAAALPGKTLHIAIVLWYRAGLTGSMTVKLGSQDLEAMGVARDAKYSGLDRLQAAGLISIDRQRGRAPVVTLLLCTSTAD